MMYNDIIAEVKELIANPKNDKARNYCGAIGYDRRGAVGIRCGYKSSYDHWIYWVEAHKLLHSSRQASDAFNVTSASFKGLGVYDVPEEDRKFFLLLAQNMDPAILHELTIAEQYEKRKEYDSVPTLKVYGKNYIVNSALGQIRVFAESAESALQKFMESCYVNEEVR